ncbi:MAG: Rrf2 family transcriptional regulator [Fretibacterium sp.]|nr:Rrf2 family transcriptional regulator [Fretibacterium sp.]MCR4818431.1 Rrf2 family transcriptional regulator [Fretibacterium sp.]
MQISSRFTIAVHIFACIDYFQGEYAITSEFLAGSINVNAVTVRRILLQLKAAGLIKISRGRGSMSAARPLEGITFFDIYKAVECVEDGELFHFHDGPNPQCPVGRNIHKALDARLEQVQRAMEDELRKITVADVARDTRKAIENEETGQ